MLEVSKRIKVLSSYEVMSINAADQLHSSIDINHRAGEVKYELVCRPKVTTVNSSIQVIHMSRRTKRHSRML